MRQRLNRTRQRVSKRVGQVHFINFGTHVHTKYDVRKHNVSICMVNENRLTNELWGILSCKQNIATANHFFISEPCIRRQSFILSLFVDARGYSAKFEYTWVIAFPRLCKALRAFS